MKKILFGIGVLLAALSFSSCTSNDESTIVYPDPQIIPFLTDYLPMDLLEYFGEENVNFGDMPPKLDGLEFKSQHTYDTTNLNTPYAPQPGQQTPVIHYHKFTQQYISIGEYLSKSSEEVITHDIYPVYIIGDDNAFTAYYYETTTTGGSPTHAVLMTGKIGANGIEDYMYGYKIVRYNEEVPANVYPAGTIFIFRDTDGISEYETWYVDESEETQE